MKSRFFISLVLCVGFLASCQKDTPGPDGSFDVRFSVSNSSFVFTPGKPMKIWFHDGRDNFVESEGASVSGSSTSFSGRIYPATASSYTFGGIYPSSCVEEGGNFTPGAYKVNLPSMQKASAGHFDPDSYLLVMKPQTHERLISRMDVSWDFAVALNKLTLKNVPDGVKSVRLTASGSKLSGKAQIDLTSASASVEIYDGSESVGVSLSSAAAAGNLEVQFSCWEASVPEGGELEIQLSTGSSSYTKTIVAKEGGINFKRGIINLLSVDFAGVEPVPVVGSISGFAKEFVKILDKFETNVGDVEIGGVVYPGVHFVPDDYTITVGDAQLGKAEMFSLAASSIIALARGEDMDYSISKPASTYPSDPRKEATTLKSEQISWETLTSIALRQTEYAQQNGGFFAGVCTFPVSGYDAGSKSLSGDCCIERSLLCFARAFRFILDSGKDSGISALCEGKDFSCDLLGGERGVFGYVKSGETPLEGVVVSDGYDVVATDKNGMYKLNTDKKSGYVFISVPSGYKAPSSGVRPVFYAYTSAPEYVMENLNFQLAPDKDQTNHTMLIFGDIHLANRTKDREQFKIFTDEINAYLAAHSQDNIYALTLGDMSWDTHWYSNDYDLNKYLSDVKAIGGLQIFHTIGNHDHDQNATGDWYTAAAYKKALGPNYYSFNIGKVHYIVLDNIECTNSQASKNNGSYRSYNCTVVDYIMDWLKKDLSYVDKTTPIIVTMHSPAYVVSGAVKVTNADELAACFDGYSNVRYYSGHTHCIYHVKKSETLQEFNSGAVCATWWWGGYYNPTLNIAPDGAPGGYRVLSVNGTQMASYYKGTGRDENYQFRSYDRNSIEITGANFGVSSLATQFQSYVSSHGAYDTPSTDNQVLINVWDYNTNWKVEVSEDNVNFKACKRKKFYDPLFLIAYSAQRFKVTQTMSFDPSHTYHMFTYNASSADATVYIRVTDDNGRVYTETMTRPRQFSLEQYK
ncbi:MAG: calcineurin-like phosphoesterase C-terminal domain-containing protein [Bacteroidales bacterium]|nr:calcineurin-like phosphoesterase C-terminal domain-containing protein [Bacteroidales bacterium]